jgi:hypothetical protein
MGGGGWSIYGWRRVEHLWVEEGGAGWSIYGWRRVEQEIIICDDMHVS